MLRQKVDVVYVKLTIDMDIYAITHQEVLERISRHCPEALWTYLQCVNRCDAHGYIFFPKKMVEVDMSADWRPFRNNIKKLARENLLEWSPLNEGISVQMAALDEDE